MSKKKVTKKSKINPTKSTIANSAAVSELASAKARLNKSGVSGPSDLLFTKTTYMYILGGIGLMVIGFFLMSGGHNEDPNVFDEDVIYSTRRILIAPIFILAGLIVQVLAIFKK